MPLVVRLLLIGLVAVIGVYVVIVVWALPRPSHSFYLGLETPLVIAHRGGAGLWPENTLFSFRRAVELGVDVLEMDVRTSLDGVLVVVHDETVDRTTDGKGRVEELTFAELRALDAGYRWSPGQAKHEFPYRGSGIQIPALKDVLDQFSETKIAIEIKPDSMVVARALCDVLREARRAESVIVGSFHRQALSAFRKACPEFATSASPREVLIFFLLNTVFLSDIFKPRMETFQVPEYQGGLRVVTYRFVAAARRKNVDVQVWTVNLRYDISRLIHMKVGGVITDRPDRALQEMGRGGQVELIDHLSP